MTKVSGNMTMAPILLLKLLLVPSLIYLVTLAGRRWGPEVAGWLSAFPIVAGPILLAVALEQGNVFAANAAEGTLLAVVAILVFSIAYAWASRYFGVLGSLVSALLAYAAAVAGLQAISLPVSVAFITVLCGLLIAPRLFPTTAGGTVGASTGKSDLPWRMLAATVLVLSVTFAAQHIGARLSGFFAMFPVMSTVLVGFSHARLGQQFAIALLRGMVLGYFAFAVFCLVVSLLLQQTSIPLAFSVALLCALTVQIAAKRMSNAVLAARETPLRNKLS
jgi:hypothetical protein